MISALPNVMTDHPVSLEESELQSESRKALQYCMAGDFEQGAMLLERLRAGHPNNAQVLMLSGILAQERGELELATSYYSRAAILAPDDPDLLTDLGQVLELQSKIHPAENAYRQALRIKPDHERALLRLGGLLSERPASSEEAMALLERVCTINPVSFEALHALRKIHAREKNDLMVDLYTRLCCHVRPDLPAMPDDTQEHDCFFVRSGQALSEAQRHLSIPLNGDVQGQRICYHADPHLPKTPEHLQFVDFFDTLNFFLATRLRWPKRVVFDPGQPWEVQTAIRFGKLLREAFVARNVVTARMIKNCRGQRPDFRVGSPLRILIAGSRLIAPWHEASLALARAFDRLGCDVRFVAESNDREGLTLLNHLAAHIQFNPHACMTLNQLRTENLHPDVFYISWWGDLVPALTGGITLGWRERDLVYSAAPHLDQPLLNTGARGVERLAFSAQDPEVCDRFAKTVVERIWEMQNRLAV